MSKQPIPNNPVCLLQRNAQVLKTLISQAGENVPITAFLAMQKCNDEAIRIIETHHNTDAFTVVPKDVVDLCRRVIEGNANTLKRGILKHYNDRVFCTAASTKLKTYQAILDRLPEVETSAGNPKPPGPKATVNLSARTSFEVERKNNGVGSNIN